MGWTHIRNYVDMYNYVTNNNNNNLATLSGRPNYLCLVVVFMPWPNNLNLNTWNDPANSNLLFTLRDDGICQLEQKQINISFIIL